MVYPVYVTQLTIEGLNPVIPYNTYNLSRDPAPGRTVRLTAKIQNDYGAPISAATVNFMVNGNVFYTNSVGCRWAGMSYINMCTNYTFPDYGSFNFCAEVVDSSVVPTPVPYPPLVPNCLEFGCPDH